MWRRMFLRIVAKLETKTFTLETFTWLQTFSYRIERTRLNIFVVHLSYLCIIFYRGRITRKPRVFFFLFRQISSSYLFDRNRNNNISFTFRSYAHISLCVSHSFFTLFQLMYGLKNYAIPYSVYIYIKKRKKPHNVSSHILGRRRPYCTRCCPARIFYAFLFCFFRRFSRRRSIRPTLRQRDRQQRYIFRRVFHSRFVVFLFQHTTGVWFKITNQHTPNE